jgi:hypothetical protein
MVCVVRALRVQRVEQDVLVVSIDRLTPKLRSAAGGVEPDPLGGVVDGGGHA